MLAVYSTLRWLLVTALASALHIDVVIHYPEKGSAVEQCGLQFRAATSFNDPAAAAPAKWVARNVFAAQVELPDSRLYEKASIGILADVSDTKVGNAACQALCPMLGSQGQALQMGNFVETQPLLLENTVEVWPAFCKPNYGESQLSFFSDAIGRQINLVVRLPSAVLENNLPRPSAMLPPILFRLNSEWYWPNSTVHYSTWHDLMVTGNLGALVVAEVYVEGVDWKSWDTQPIYTTEPLNYTCRGCDPQLQFICDSWESSAYFIYRGGNHSFGSAARFFDELYDMAMPLVLQRLPDRSDNEILRVGMWGYCIGGLAAWNAMVLRPERYNIAYLGSPAMDFDCGDAFRAVRSLSWGAVRPRIYIDSGAAEGQLMNRMALMLLRMLQDQGLEEGRDVFYVRAAFGTHQANAFLRRALTGLMVLFGSGRPGQEVYTPAMRQTQIIVQPDNMTMGGQWFSSVILFFIYHGCSMVLLCFGAVVIFILGRLSVVRHMEKSGQAREPLLLRAGC